MIPTLFSNSLIKYYLNLTHINMSETHVTHMFVFVCLDDKLIMLKS